LLVGTTSDGGADGVTIHSSGYIQARKTSNVPAYFDRLTNDGTIIALRKDGSDVGSIGTLSGWPYFSRSSHNTGFALGGADIFPVGTAGSANDDALNLGSNTARWKDLYLSGGVYLGGTGAANKLDDYEEGTWTPTITGATSGSLTLTVAQATYTKIGELVHVRCYISASSGSLSGALRMNGLPFNPQTFSVVGVTYNSMFFDYPLMGYTESDSNYINFRQGSSTTQVDSTTYNGSGSIMVSATYETTA